MTDSQTISYVFTALSLAILCFRVAITVLFRNSNSFNAAFYLVLFTIALLLARIVVNYYLFNFGTNADVLSGQLEDYDPTSVKIGSILVLGARLLLTTILWLQMAILLIFYRQLFSHTRVKIIRGTWILLAATYLGTIAATLLECRPIQLYWQISPPPGKCFQAVVQLLVQGACNCVVDITLLFIAFPILRLQKRTLREHVRLYTLFSLGTFCIATTIVRVALVFISGTSQDARILWSSLQNFTSIFVANLPAIYGTIRQASVKRRNAHSTAQRNSRNNAMNPGLTQWRRSFFATPAASRKTGRCPEGKTPDFSVGSTLISSPDNSASTPPTVSSCSRYHPETHTHDSTPEASTSTTTQSSDNCISSTSKEDAAAW